MEKSVQLAALHLQVAPLAFTDNRVPMISLVGPLVGRQLQFASPKHLPMVWAFPMIGLVGQLAAHRLQVALPGRSPMDWPFNGLLNCINDSINAIY